MRALPLHGGYDNGPLFVIQKRRAPMRTSTTMTGRIRRRSERRATPPWADLVAIRALYAEAQRLTRETGEQHEVDHIIPLIHPLVCGLHVHANMRIVHWRENASKGNRTFPGMPFEQMELI